MNDLSEFIKQERAKNPQQAPQSGANVRSSLLALKNAVDGFGSLEGNPLIENIKKVETVVERKDNNGFIPPVTSNKQIARVPIQEQQMVYDEKDDKFTKDLLMKTRQFVTGGTIPVQQQQQSLIRENTIHQISPVEPDPRFNGMHSSSTSKNDVISVLKDTIMDLYVKEKVESVIKEYLQTDEGKMLIKSIVVGLFKKK